MPQRSAAKSKNRNDSPMEFATSRHAKKACYQENGETQRCRGCECKLSKHFTEVSVRHGETGVLFVRDLVAPCGVLVFLSNTYVPKSWAIGGKSKTTCPCPDPGLAVAVQLRPELAHLALNQAPLLREP